MRGRPNIKCYLDIAAVNQRQSSEARRIIKVGDREAYR
jgi:hypothetical protein